MAFVDHDFAVAVPLRQGYGRSEGTANDMVGSCEMMDYSATARATAQDAEGVISFMQQQSFIDPRSVIIVGHSHGGFGALGVASDAPNGVVGVLTLPAAVGRGNTDISATDVTSSLPLSAGSGRKTNCRKSGCTRLMMKRLIRP